MRSSLAAAAFVTVLLLAGCGGGNASTNASRADAPSQTEASAADTASPGDPTVVAAATGGSAGPATFDGARAVVHIDYLATTIGPRVSGSAGEQRAAEYLRAQLQADGYAVELVPFQFEGDRFQEATVTAGGSTFAALTLAGSKRGTASGAGVPVGLGDTSDVQGKGLTGAIALADRGVLRFGDKYRNVRGAGAAGLIIANDRDGTFSGDLLAAADVPVVAVTQADGQAIRAAAAAGSTVRIDAPEGTLTTAINVLARANPGAHCSVLVGGHYDTVPSAPGANDNASGTAIVLELARAFAVDHPREGLCFAAFSAEESGLYGSAKVVQELASEGPLPTAMVNLDVTGIGHGVGVIGSAGLVQHALVLAAKANILAIAADLPANSASDHQSFRDAGVPVVFFSSGDFPAIHTPQDVASAVDPAEVQRVGTLAYATVSDLVSPIAQGSRQP